MTFKRANKAFSHIFIFQRKFIFTSVIISVVLGILGAGLNGKPIYFNAGMSYLLVQPLIHFFTYDMQNPNEYYFYFNLGLSKILLWGITTFQAIMVFLIVTFI